MPITKVVVCSRISAARVSGPTALVIRQASFPAKTITERQAAEGLISNVLRVERALERCVKQQPPQKVYDAAVSFAFNVGTGNACSSTLVKLLNQRRWADACRQLPRWVYVKGVFNQGLDNRRAREMAWCLKGAGL